MLRWQPPLDDVAFLLGPWLRAGDDWKRIPRFATLDSDTAEAVLAEAGRFCAEVLAPLNAVGDVQGCRLVDGDRKSTRLNSSHVKISYAVFCLKKKKKQRRND